MGAIDVKKFKMQIKNEIDDVLVQSQEFKEKIGFDCFAGIVKRTPVDTGRARGNWMVSLGSAVEAVVDSGPTISNDEPVPSALKNEGLSTISKSKPGQDIVISNNLPYIVRLEEGHSKQAPTGMVAHTLARVSKEVI